MLDAVGIDGARLATALAWSETSFEAALRARAPSLVALAFGTNEAFDADKMEKYRTQYRELVRRVRLAAPDTDCLIVGPPDAVAVAGGSNPRVTELDALAVARWRRSSAAASSVNCKSWAARAATRVGRTRHRNWRVGIGCTCRRRATKRWPTASAIELLAGYEARER